MILSFSGNSISFLSLPLFLFFLHCSQILLVLQFCLSPLLLCLLFSPIHLLFVTNSEFLILHMAFANSNSVKQLIEKTLVALSSFRVETFKFLQLFRYFDHVACLRQIIKRNVMEKVVERKAGALKIQLRFILFRSFQVSMVGISCQSIMIIDSIFSCNTMRNFFNIFFNKIHPVVYFSLEEIYRRV